jgi:hypothetical protein
MSSILLRFVLGVLHQTQICASNAQGWSHKFIYKYLSLLRYVRGVCMSIGTEHKHYDSKDPKCLAISNRAEVTHIIK